MKSHVTLVNPPYPKGAHQYPPFTPLGIRIGVTLTTFTHKSALKTIRTAEEASNVLTILAVAANLV